MKLEGKVAVVTGAAQRISSGTPFRGVPFLLHYVEGRDRRLHARAREGARPGRDPRQLRRAGFTMSEGVKSHPEVVEKLRDVFVAARTLQRDQTPEELVGAAVFLAGPDSDFVTGQAIVIDGGQYFH